MASQTRMRLVFQSIVLAGAAASFIVRLLKAVTFPHDPRPNVTLGILGLIMCFCLLIWARRGQSEGFVARTERITGIVIAMSGAINFLSAIGLIVWVFTATHDRPGEALGAAYVFILGALIAPIGIGMASLPFALDPQVWTTKERLWAKRLLLPIGIPLLCFAVFIIAKNPRGLWLFLAA